MSVSYPLVAFDLDGTLACGLDFVWSLLHSHFRCDVDRRVAAREDFFARRISYAEWFATDLELLGERGATREAMLEAFAAIQPMPGAHEVLEQLQRQRRRIAIISGSVDLLLDRLFPGFPFDHVLINRLHFDDAGELIGGEPTCYDMERKADGLEHLAQVEGLALSQCAFLGDHENDLDVLRAAGLGIAFNPCSDRVRAAADVSVAGPDLRAVLPYLT